MLLVKLIITCPVWNVHNSQDILGMKVGQRHGKYIHVFKKCFTIGVCITINICRWNVMKCMRDILNNIGHHKARIFIKQYGRLYVWQPLLISNVIEGICIDLNSNKNII